MSTLPTRFSTELAQTQPLTPQEMGRVEQFAPRLIDELHIGLSRVRTPGQSALALSRSLGVHRNICQRIVAALDSRLAPMEALRRLPGPEGIRLFAEALAQHIGTQAKQQPLLLVAEHYDRLILELAGSQAKFVRRIAATSFKNRLSVSPERDEQSDMRYRRQIRRAAANLLGTYQDLYTFVNIVRPMPGSPELIEGIQGCGRVGFCLFGRPLITVSRGMNTHKTMGNIANEVRSVPLVDEPGNAAGLLPELCSKPLPRGIHDDSDGVAREMVDLSEHAPGPVDVVTARRWWPGLNPMYDDRWWIQGVKGSCPTSRMLIDVYLHQSMAKVCTPSAAAFQWTPDLDPIRNQAEKLPGRLTVEVLGPGTAAAASDAWAQQRRLTDIMFELGGWNPAEFIGYRCDVREPLWEAAYHMLFNFADQGSSD